MLNRIDPVKTLPGVSTRLNIIPDDSTDLMTAKDIIKQLGIKGEIDFISKNNGLMAFPVRKPGFKSNLEINTTNGNVLITSQAEGSLRGMSYLHSMPGQHNAKIRGNSVFIKVWRNIADITVYLIFFLTASGIFLWYFLDYERKPGLFSLILGAILFTTIMVLIF